MAKNTSMHPGHSETRSEMLIFKNTGCRSYGLKASVSLKTALA